MKLWVFKIVSVFLIVKIDFILKTSDVIFI